MKASAALGFWALLLALCFLGLDRDLWTPDEPREAEISREMLLAPSLIPTLNGEAFLEKPPLYYWTVASLFALLGGPSSAVARAVSALASFLTLVLVFYWGRRQFGPGVGLVAAFGLATSAQFLVTSHWVLMDPLLMLFTTAALLAATELVHGRTSVWAIAIFNAALVLALWTKGLIGPVLVASGLIAYALIRRSFEPLRRLRPILSVVILTVAAISFAALLNFESGYAAVREWFWTNHVQRFFDPTDATGHDQPFYYYLSAIPIAVLPWLVPFCGALLPSTWKTTTDSEPDASRDQRIFFGALCLGMAAVLSAAATKRGIYLLPMLPPLFVLLGAIGADWWAKHSRDATRVRGVTAQLSLSVLFAAAPVAVGLIYLRSADALSIAYLTAVTALWLFGASAARRKLDAPTLIALGSAAVIGGAGLLGVTVRLASPSKDLTPFVEQINERHPGSEPIYVIGDFDETIRGIVPFVTGRFIARLAVQNLDAVRPPFVLVHVKVAEQAESLEPHAYDLVDGRRFGPERYMALWRRRDGATAQANAPTVIDYGP